jgi:hypothetical protein
LGSGKKVRDYSESRSTNRIGGKFSSINEAFLSFFPLIDIEGQIQRRRVVRGRLPSTIKKGGRMKSFRLLVLTVLFAFGQLTPTQLHAHTNLTPANAPTGTYKEAVIQIVFSDETDADHPLTVADLDAAGPVIHTYFSDLSYGKLNLELSFIRVHLSTTFASYGICFRCGFNPLLQDAINAAIASDSTFFNSMSGVSILILPSYGEGDFTDFGLNSYSGFPQQVEQSLLSETTPNPFWGGWAHEFGHQLEFYGGSETGSGWLGHPSGYASGYDLMDSCYPCHESSYGLLGTPFVTDPRTVFAGWLNSDHVAVVPIPTSGPVGQTFVLAPLSQNISTPVIQAVEVPIDGNRSYWVDARARLGSDDYQDGGRGIFSQGVQIQYTDVNAEFPVTVCRPSQTPTCTNTDTDPPDWPYLLWEPGNTFSDSTNNITIKVVAAVTGGWEVQVNRDVPPHHPDLYITPWLTPPMDTYETVDIWVDSICNGYGVLRYGKRADGTVIGNGDDPCVDHQNRVYVTVHNIGDADSTPTTASFQVSHPLGVGVTGSWTQLGKAAVPAIPAGGSATVFVTWTPTPNLTAAEIKAARFSFHSCIQVSVAPVPGEVIKTNNMAQENIGYFDVVAQGTPVGGKYKFPIINGSFNVTNLIAGNVQQYSLEVVSRLPAGWTYSVNGGKRDINIFSGQTANIPVVITPPPSAVGQIYDLRAAALTMLSLSDHGSDHPSWFVEGGVDLNAHTVLPSAIAVTAAIPTQGITGLPTLISGKVDPAVKGAIVTVDLLDSTSMESAQFTVQEDGAFGGSMTPSFAPSEVRAIWQGNMTYAGVVSNGTITQRFLTSTALVSSLNPAAENTPVTLTATVTPITSSATPTGSVTFKNGSTVLGTVALVKSTSGDKAAFTTSKLPVGSLSITADYSGDDHFLPSTSPVLTEVVTK